ncbi:hypothetical protein CDIK_4343 [Cucumispora dikerogammari]|nr:hypothetical protein CDIK_4343 [Cucumispora dikerogammari]
MDFSRRKKDIRDRNHSSKVAEVHLNFITNKIESNPKITLQELVEVIENRFELRLSKQTISRHLDLLLYTLKDFKQEREAANSSENKIKRQQFARSLLSYQSGSLPILFIDESNFNLHISKTEVVRVRVHAVHLFQLDLGVLILMLLVA